VLRLMANKAYAGVRSENGKAEAYGQRMGCEQ